MSLRALAMNWFFVHMIATFRAKRDCTRSFTLGSKKWDINYFRG